MEKIQIDSLDDLSISGFDIKVKSPNGEVQTISDGLSSLLKGQLSISTFDGVPVSRSGILSKVNLDSSAAVLIPDLIKSQSDKNLQEDASRSSENKEIKKQEIEDLQNKLNELKELRKKLEKENKEKSEENKEEKEKQEAEAEAKESQMVEEMLRELAQDPEAASAVVEPETSMGTGEADANDNVSKKRNDFEVPPSTGTSSGVAPPPEDEEEVEAEPETELFVEFSMSSRSDSGTKGDDITNSKNPTFEGKSLPGASIILSIDGMQYQAVADSNGDFIISVSEALLDGEYGVNIVAKDDAGNEVSIIKQIIIDTVPPEVSFELQLDSPNPDNLTNINPPTFTGKVTGDPVKMFITIGSQTFDVLAKNGEFNFTLPVEMDDGLYEVSFTAVDEAGNETTVKEHINIDTVNHFDVSLSTSSDSGLGGDWVTNKETVSFRFEHEIGAKIQVIYNNKIYNVETGETSPTLFQFDVPFSEGAHQIEFISVDLAGNRVVVEKNFVVDMTPPSFFYDGLSAEANSGDLSDSVTSVNKPIFEGRAEVGSTVYLEIDGVTYSAPVEENGHWSLSITNELRDGDYEITFYAKDLAGNDSGIISSTVSIDTQGPVLTGGFDADSDSGASNKDALTNVKDLKFSGQTDPNTKVTLVIEELGITQDIFSDDNGHFSFGVFDVPEGSFEYQITAVDLAGNQSVNELTGNVVVDRNVTDFTARISEEFDTGENTSDHLTSSTLPTFQGTGEAGAKILITVISPNGASSTPYGPVTVNEKGEWSFSLTNPLNEDGDYTVRFDVTDLAGNKKDIDLPITIDTHAELTAQFDPLSDSGEADNITNVSMPSFSGTAEAGSTIKLVLTHALTGKTVEVETLALRDGTWSLSVPDSLKLTEQGDWSWSVKATDLAGNISSEEKGEFVFDDVPPSAEIALVSQTGFDDTHTNDNTLDFSVRTEPDIKVSLSIYKLEHGVVSSTPAYQSDTPLIVPSNGELVVSSTVLPDGEYIYQFTLMDVAGNTSITSKAPVTIDTVLPELGTVSLTADSDSNISDDNITSNKELTFKGSGGETGSHIHISVENVMTGEIINLIPSSFEVTSTNWVYTLPFEFDDGTYSISFIAKDAAGNESPSITTEINIDNAPPPISDVFLERDSDTGISHEDFITQNTNPVFMGASELGAMITVSIYRGTTLVTTATVKVENEDGTWKVPVLGLVEGEYSWSVSAKDVAGNEEILSSPDQILTVDTSYLDASGKLDDSSNTGSLTDNITNEQNISLSGSGEGGSSVVLKSLIGPDGRPIDITSALSSVISTDGTWSLNIPTLSVGDGVYQWEVELTDLAGNFTTTKGEINLDTETSISGRLESDTGQSDQDAITNDNTPSFSGKAEANSLVKIVLLGPDGNKVENTVSTVVTKEGNWRITLPELLQDGEYTWRAEITDIAGNQSSTENQTFTLDTSLPIVSEVSLDSSVGFEVDPPQVNGESLAFSGKISEGNGTVSVHFYSVTNGVVSGTPLFTSPSVTADESGNFVFNFETELPDGEYSWSVEASDLAGNSSKSDPSTIIIDNTTPLISDVGLSDESDTSLVPGNNYTGDVTPTFVGKSEAGTRISIELRDADGKVILLEPAYATTKEDGSWSYTPSTLLNDGAYTYIATAMDPAGNSTPSGEFFFHVDSHEPEITFNGLTSDSDSGSDQSDMLTNDIRPVFSGTVSENSKVTIVLQSTSTGPDYTFETLTTSGGAWQITAPEDLLEGEYNIHITATDLAGNISDVLVSPNNLVIDQSVVGGDDFGLSADTDSGESSADDLTNINNIKLQGEVEAGTTITLTSLTGPDGQPIEMEPLLCVTADLNGNWSLNVPPFGDLNGSYSYTLKYIDLAGNEKNVNGAFVFDTSVSVSGQFDSETGNVDGEIYTNHQAPSFSGKGEPNSTIKIVIIGSDGNPVENIPVAVVGADGSWSITLPELPLQGEYTWRAEITDLAGNTNKTPDKNFVLDSIIPTVTSVELEIKAGFETDPAQVNQDNLSFTGYTSEGGAGVVVHFYTAEGGSTPVLSSALLTTDSAGRFTFDFSTQLPDGEYRWQVEASDAAGNASKSELQSIVIDSSPPSISDIGLSSESNSGLDESSNFTNESIPTFVGKSEAGIRISIEIRGEDGEILSLDPAYVTTQSDGNWSYTPSTLINDGAYTYIVTAMDPAGNTTPSESFSFQVDTGDPSLTFEGLSAETDSGAENNDMLTNAERPVFTGTVSENSIVTVVLKSTSGGSDYTFTTATTVTGAWQIVPTENLLEGDYILSITATDLAGNSSNPLTVETNLVIDRTVEGAEDFSLSADTDSGSNTSDNITNANMVKINGEVEAGTLVTLSSLTRPDGSAVDINPPLTATAGPDGRWSIDVPAFGEQNGSYSYTLQYVDLAGNEKSVDGEFIFDNIIDLSASFDSQTGMLDDAVYTNVKEPSISGTGKAGDTVSVVISGPSGDITLTTTIGSDGTWILTAPEMNTDGPYTWTATVTDLAGNSASLNNSFNLDTQKPVLEMVQLDSASDSGLVTNDGITNDTTPSFTVKGEAGSSVVLNIFAGTSTTGAPIWNTQTLQMPSSGILNIELPIENELFEGQYTWNVILTDIAGNETISTPQNLQIDTTIPTLGSVNLISDSGTNSDDWITNDNTPLFEGVAESGARITLTVTNALGLKEDIIPAYVTVGEDGTWTYPLTTELMDGSYSITVIVEDTAGNKIESESKTLSIDTVAPLLQDAMMSKNSDTGKSDEDNITSDATPEFEGRSEKGALITLLIKQGDHVLHTLTTTVENEDGSWNINNVPALPEGDYSWHITATDVAGNETPASTGVLQIDKSIENVTVRLSAEDDLGHQNNDGITNKSDVKLTGTAENNATITLSSLTFNGAPIDVSAVSSILVTNGQWELPLPTLGLGDGIYSYTIQVEDLAGNIKPFTGTITLDTHVPALTAQLETDSDTGTKGDEITKDNTPSFTGTLAEASKVTLTLFKGAEEYKSYGPFNENGTWRIDITDELEDGTYTWVIEAIDLAGNISEVRETITIDTTPPTITAAFDSALDSGLNDEDSITNETNLVIKGHVSGESSSVNLRFEFGLKGTTPQVFEKTLESGGDFSFNAQATVDGIYDWKIVSIDVAGNESEKIGSIHVDTQMNAFSEDTGLDVSSDLGDSNTDNISNVTTPTFKGTTEAGAKVVLTMTLNGNEVIQVESVADDSGLFSITLEPPMVLAEDGQYEWNLKATDLAGNEQEKVGSYTLDTTTPEIEFNLESDTENESDWITKDPLLSLRGTTNDTANIVVTVMLGSEIIDTQSITPTGENWNYTFDTPLGDGRYTLKIESTDIAGNKFTAEKELVVDTVIVNTFELTSDHGISTTDQLTNEEFLGFSGNTDKEAMLSLSVKNASGDLLHTFEPLVDPETGAWSFELPIELEDGQYLFTSTVVDVAGNRNVSEEYRVTVDRTPPEIISLELSEENDTGALGDWSTESQIVSLNGECSPGSSIQILISGISGAIHATVDSSGRFSATLPELEFGDYILTIVAMDAAGNISDKTQTLSIQDDPIPFDAGLSEETDTGIKGDNVTSNNLPIFTGTGTPGYTIEMQIAGVTYSTHVNENSEWTINVSSPLPEGTYSATFVIYDRAGNETMQDNYDFEIDRSVTFTAEISDEIGTGTDHLINEKRPVFHGSGEVNAEIIIMLNGIEYSTNVNSSGHWMFTVPVDLADGKYDVSFRSIDLAGNESETKNMDFTIDTLIPELSYEIEGLYENNGVSYINSHSESFTFKGSASEKGTVTLQINNQEFTQVLSSAGSWSIELPDIVEREHAYTIFFTDEAGNKITHTGVVVVDKSINCFAVFSDAYNSSYHGQTNNYADNQTNSKTLGFDFNGRYKTDKDVTVSITVTGPNGFQFSETNVPTDSRWTMPIAVEFDGNYNFQFEFKDAAGNTYSKQENVTVDTRIDALDMNDFSFDGVPLEEGTPLETSDKYVSLDFTLPLGCEYVAMYVRLDNFNYKAVEIDGVWSFVGIPLKGGLNNLVITAWDAAGNKTDIQYTIMMKTDFTTLDLSINGLELTDIGNIKDIISNNVDGVVSLTGKIDAGATVEILVDGEIVNTLTVGANGEWAYDLALMEGNNKVVIKFSDEAGNSKLLNFNAMIDTEDPMVSIETIEGEGFLEEGSDMSIKGDTVTFSGRIDAGSSIKTVLLNGVEIDLSGQDVSKNKWSVAISGLIEGDNTIVIVSEDLAGNQHIDNMQIHRDSIVSDFSVNIDNEDLNGVIYESPTFSGRVEIGATLSMEIINSQTLEKLTFEPLVNADGTWTMPIPDLADGTYSWIVNAIDAAGNQGTLVSEQDFTRVTDTLNPVFSIDAIEGEGFQNIEHEMYVRGDTVSLSGSIDEASSVHSVTLNGNLIDLTGQDLTDGTWRVDVSGLQEGINILVIESQDLAGNKSIENRVIHRDSIVSEFRAEIENVEGVIYESPLFSGTVEIGATLSIVITNSQTLENTTFSPLVNADGTWQMPIPDLADGQYSWSVNAIDAAGNESTISSEQDFSRVTDTLDPIFSIDTIEGDGFQNIGNEMYVHGDTVSLSGSIDEGSSIDSLTLNGVLIDLAGQDLTNETWSVGVSGLQEGMNTLVIESKDLAGNSSTTNLVIHRDTSVTDLTADLQDLDETGTILEIPTFMGTVELGSSVSVLITNTLTSESVTLDVPVSPDGNWSVSAPDLSDGTYAWSVLAVDLAGNQSTFSSESDFTLQKDPILAPEVPFISDNPLLPEISESSEKAALSLEEKTYSEPPPFLSEEVLSADKTHSLSEEKSAVDPVLFLSEEKGVLENTPLLETKVFTGESEPETLVSLTIDNQTYETHSDYDGDWTIKVEFSEASTYAYELEYQEAGGEPKLEQGNTRINEINIDAIESGSGKEGSDPQERSPSSDNAFSSYSNQNASDHFEMNFENDSY